MNTDKPTQAQFQSAQTTLQQMLNTYAPDIDVRKASVVRQLVIRPLAYLFAQIQRYIKDRVKQSSIMYLLTSDKVQNQTADLVASNYFVQRLQSGYASGVLTAKCSTSSVTIPRDTLFSVDGISFFCPKAVIASTNPQEDTNAVNYVKMFSIDNYYYCNIPIRAVQPGFVQIPSGVLAATNSYIGGIVQDGLSVTSPITGGSSTQTDAQMMRRCIKKCGAAVGTQNAIWTRLQQSPVNVISCKAIGSADAGCFRARYNNLAIPRGGVVDVYVKTQNQPSVKTIDIQVATQGTAFQINPAQYTDIKGFIRIRSIKSSAATLPDYSIQYQTTSDDLSAQGARLSGYQKATILFKSAISAGTTLKLDIQYIPGIAQVQTYMDNQDIAFLGQSTLVKSAVPVALKIHCSVQSPQAIDKDTLVAMRQSIAKLVCAYEVGTYKLNMTDIAEAFHASYPDAILKLPYNIQVIMPTKNGGLYQFQTDSGFVDITYKKGLYSWDTAAYYFYSTPDFIDLVIV